VSPAQDGHDAAPAGARHSALAEPAPGGSRRRAAERLGLAVVLLAVGGLLYALGRGVRGTAADMVPGAPAPDIETITYDGEPLALADLRGRVVVVNFWASWCVECVAEAAVLEAIWQDYRDRGVVVLGLAYTDTEPAARAFAAGNGMTFPIGPDLGGRASQAYGLTGVPETVVIDRDGRIVGRQIGPLTEAALRSLLTEAMAGERATDHA
jgi:cytochrome c biogenesis protein CcmG/thiol:disulfide interchange protein DsbE